MVTLSFASRLLALRKGKGRVGSRMPHLDEIGPGADRDVTFDDFASHLGEHVFAAHKHFAGEPLLSESAQGPESQTILIGDHRLKVVVGLG